MEFLSHIVLIISTQIQMKVSSHSDQTQTANYLKYVKWHFSAEKDANYSEARAIVCVCACV